MVIWNIDTIEKLTPEGKLRNLCRQLEQETREWNRYMGPPIGYGSKASHGAQSINNPRVKLLCWGKGFKAKGQVFLDGAEFSKPLSLANDAEQIYLELGAALDRAQD